MTLLKIILVIVLSVTSMRGTQTNKPANPPEAVKAGDFIFVSGIVVEKGDLREQTREVLNRLSRVLQSSGSSLAQTASVYVYLRDAADFEAMNEVYRTFWPKDPPARTTIIAGLVAPSARVQISAVALRNGAERTVIHPSGWQKSPNYSYGIRSGDTLFLAGLVARDPKTGADTGGDITVQTRQVLQNAGEILKAGGMSHTDAVSSRVFITDAAQFQTMNTAYRPFFPQAPPARATVKAKLARPQYAVEITLLAVRHADRQVINTGGENLPYSSAVRVGNRLFVSGMIGSTESNSGDAATQTRQSLDRIGEAMKAAGFAWSDVVDQIVYVTGADHHRAVDQASHAVFGNSTSARTTIVTELVIPPPLVEIMLVAVRKK
jgi:enamine deaminase RidA (YjgF/YER057c/UK114 family)